MLNAPAHFLAPTVNPYTIMQAARDAAEQAGFRVATAPPPRVYWPVVAYRNPLDYMFTTGPPPLLVEPPLAVAASAATLLQYSRAKSSLLRSSQKGQPSGFTAAPGCDGTTYKVLREGSGAAVKKGSMVTLHARGVVQQTGKKFWSTEDPGQQAFSYQAGVGQVIKGWDQGLLGAKIGETRQVIIVGKEGYGSAGFPAWGIPPDATLDFTLQVLEIK